MGVWRGKEMIYIQGKKRNQIKVGSQVSPRSCCTLREKLLLPKPMVDISFKMRVISCY